MKVGVIGAGNMGSAFARRLSAAGHEVSIASRDIEDARNVAATVAGGAVRAVPQQELAEGVELVIAATYFPSQVDALRASGRLDGKIVVEISNPLKPDMSGLAVGFTTSAAEEVAKAIPGAKLVKAFNTVFAQVLAGEAAAGAAAVQVFYAGDDEDAKRTVRTLIESMGFEPVDAGPLSNARLLEPMGMLNIYLGYAAKMGTDIAPAVRKVSGEATGAGAEQSARQRARSPDRESQPRAG